MSTFKDYNKEKKIIRVMDSIFCDWDKSVDICIYPFGKFARFFKKVLNEKYGIHEKYIVDNNLCGDQEEIHILSLDEFRLLDHSRIKVFLISDREDIYCELRNQLHNVININNIVDVLSISMFFDREVFWDSTYFDYSNCQYPRFLMLESCAKEIYQNKVEGAIVECGVFEGNFAKIMRKIFPERKFYLFDTFEGFSDADITEEEYKLSGYFMEKVDFFRTVPTEMQIISKLAYNKNVSIKKGYFPDTAFGVEEIEKETYAFVDLDTDLYNPIMAGLEFFWPRLAKGGSIMIDEARCKELPSARNALIEFCRKNSLAFNSIEYDLPERQMKDAVGIITKPY